MTEKDEHRQHVEAADRAASALVAPLGPGVRKIIEEVVGDAPALTPEHVGRIMNRVDGLLATVYPVRRGAPSRMEDLVATAAFRAARPTMLRTAKRLTGLIDGM